jgi:hypothetical protein
MMYNEQKTRELSSPTPSLASQNDNVQQKILSFLNVKDVRSMMRVNHRYRRLLVSDGSQELWKEFCRRQWPWLQTDNVQLVDDFHLPTAAAGKGSEQPNFALLLSMAAAKPTRIDESLFESPSDFFSRCENCNRAVRKAKLETIRTASGAVQYVEPRVPAGRICIRADRPLPRPKHRTQGPTWRPFVAPVVMSMSSAETYSTQHQLQQQLPPPQVHVNLTLDTPDRFIL